MKLEDLLPQTARRDPAPTRRLVAVLPPPSPLWVVYYHQEYVGTDGELSLDPVLLLNIWEERSLSRDGDPETVSAEISPVVMMDGRLLEEDEGTVNYLGLTDRPAVSLHEWRDKISWCLRRSKMAAGVET